MSVILDALQKARGDRKRNTAPAGDVEAVGNNVARVLDAGLHVAAPPPEATPRSAGARGGWVLPVLIGILGLLLVVMAGGAFFLLYQQLGKLDGRPNAPVLNAGATAVPGVNGGAVMGADAAGAGVPAESAALPTPVPVSELPVQTPGVDNANGGAAVQVSGAKRADFTLGSIVCEHQDCIASVNGRSVRVGDVVKGYRVIKIDATTVTIKNVSGSDELTLSLFD